MQASSSAAAFDENKSNKQMDLYSRQIGTFGVETMRNLVCLRVLIVGCKGVGVEAAKNIILAGPAAVTIHDDEPVTRADLGTNFFLLEEHIGKARAACCVARLQALNPYVVVSAHSGEISDDFLKTFGAIVVTNDTPLKTQKHWCNVAHNHKIVIKQKEKEGEEDETVSISYLHAATNGLTATLFADFGPAHLVKDPDGELPVVNPIEAVELVTPGGEEKPYLSITVSNRKHGLEDGEPVSIVDVVGMEPLNAKWTVHRIYKSFIEKKDGKDNTRTVLVPNKLRINGEGCEKWPAYLSGGLITQEKVPRTLSFNTLTDSIPKPLSEEDAIFGVVRHPNTEKHILGRANHLHFARLALWKFQEEKGSLPELHNKEHAQQVVAYAKEILEEHKKIEGALTVDELDEKVVENTAFFARAELPGFCAFLGGVIAQEVIKKFGKYKPINQWVHVDYFELIQDHLQPTDLMPQNSRYDHQISIFGSQFQEKIFKQKWFMIGTGALGCEYLKGFALMGLGAKGGELLVTDMDRIEVSNLNRQFLFNSTNVGSSKAQTAAKAVQVMNPDIKVTVFETPVGPDTEETFDDNFWDRLDGVCNALDNIKAREYSDSKCVFFGKPLLEAGTLGTKANSEIVIPYKTKSYSQHEKTEDDNAIPMCTLRNFPHLIEHCIEWARAQFTEIFEAPPKNINSFLKDKQSLLSKMKKQNQTEELTIIRDVLEILSGGLSYDTCIRLAFRYYTTFFVDKIKNLIHYFPIDAVNEDPITQQKTPFWTGVKRFPQAADLNPNNPLQMDFLQNSANLFAHMCNIPPIREPEKFKTVFSHLNLSLPDWKPNESFAAKVKTELKDEAKGRNEETETGPEMIPQNNDEFDQLVEELNKIDVSKVVPLAVADFEKDDDTNFHIDWITATSNMRAWNYHIANASRHKCKMIAGRIIPAVATTTAMITGLVSLEMYKLILGNIPMDKFCCANINLGYNDLTLFEPAKPQVKSEFYDEGENCIVKPVPLGFTCWDKIIISGDITVQQFLDKFTELHHGCKLESLYFKHPKDQANPGNAPLVWGLLAFTAAQKKAKAENPPRKLTEICEEFYGPIPASKKCYEMFGSVVDADDNPVAVPTIQFCFRSKE